MAIVACVALLAGVAIGHVAIGARTIGPSTVIEAIIAYDRTNFDHKIIVELRLLRLLAGIVVGGALGMAGALLQSIIRNPLGEPHILGLNAGAALAVVLTTALGGNWLLGTFGRPLIAAGGAAALFCLVMGLSAAGRSGLSPLKATFCGVAFSAFASAMTAAVLILDDQTMSDLRIWLAGDLAGLTYAATATAGLTAAVGAALAMFLSPQLNAMAMGDNLARGLGVDLARTRTLGLAAAALLCGAAVSIAGPIGFVGLVVPHLVRRFVSADIRTLMPLCAIVGAIVLLAADCLARTIVAPQELATGVMTAIVGAPVFIAIVSRTFR